MSALADARADFVTALDQVPGVKYYPATPGTPKEGDAWLRWRAERDDDVNGYSLTWWLAIVTPQDEVTAEQWIDDHIDDLLTWLRRAATVRAWSPANVNPENGPPIFGLLITMDRE